MHIDKVSTHQRRISSELPISEPSYSEEKVWGPQPKKGRLSSDSCHRQNNESKVLVGAQGFPAKSRSPMMFDQSSDDFDINRMQDRQDNLGSVFHCRCEDEAPPPDF